MNQHGSFIDLRLNQQSGQGNDSFWPSFTDVMTVIMMIFLISMVVVLLRNMELVKEVRATVEAERQAMELARTTGEEKENIASQLETALEQLHQTEIRNNELQMEVLRLQEQNQIRGDALKDRSEQITRLTAERDQLEQQLLASKTAQQQLKDEAKAAIAARNLSQQELQNKQSAIEQLQQQLAAASSNTASLEQALASEREQAEAARQQQQQIEDKYLVLADEFDNLKVRYDKLVRPARSAKGRHLVEVRYFKKKGNYFVEWRDNGTGEFTGISRKKLDATLSMLMKKHKNGLYIKVILPKNNGLTYSEAWRFTNHLHKAYDYYYQDASPPATTDEAN